MSSLVFDPASTEASKSQFSDFSEKGIGADFSRFISLSRLVCELLLNGAVRAGTLQEPQADGNCLGPTQEKTLGGQSGVG